MRKRHFLSDVLLIMAFIIYAESLFGPIRPMIVMSRSMEPSIKRGNIIIGRKVDDTLELEVGDVCTYIPKGESYTVTHRIIDKNNCGFMFKGDNNDQADGDIVKKDQIKYKIISVRAGHF